MLPSTGERAESVARVARVAEGVGSENAFQTGGHLAGLVFGMFMTVGNAAPHVTPWNGTSIVLGCRGGSARVATLRELAIGNDLRWSTGTESKCSNFLTVGAQNFELL